MPLDIDVVVEPDPTHSPLGIFVRFGRQLLQRRAIEFEEQIAPTDAKKAHRPRVEIDNQLGDRLVQLGEREEAAVSEPSEHPTPDHPHGHPHLGLAPWAPPSAPNDSASLMGPPNP